MARPKGAKNKIGADARAILAELIAAKAAKVRTLWDEVAEIDPARAIELYAKLAEYVIPKLGRTEVTGKEGEPVKVIEIFSYSRAPAE